MTVRSLLPLVSTLGLLLASCGHAATGEKAAEAASGEPSFTVESVAGFDEPWAMAFDEGTGTLFVTEKKGYIRLRTPDGRMGMVSGVPDVDYGGQGGLGDFIFAPGQTSATLDTRVVYLSWAEAGAGNTRGAAVGKANLVCTAQPACKLEDLKVIWRQSLKVTGRGHYSHRLAFSPDGQYLFVSSGERQKQQPAQDLSNNLGTIVRLLPDGTPAPGNPFADKPAPTNQIWSYGHRNVLGLAFDPQGRLWDLEHGPAGGDELNLVKPGLNYGWPLVSDGDHYNGTPIPRHSTRPDLAAPAISWNPVIAPGDFIFYTGDLFPAWKGQALIASFAVPGLVRVSIDGEKGVEEARYPLGNRIREIEQGPDGAIWLLEDGPAPDSGHLLRLVPAGETAN
ncbi:PQQ-dependent sugar dehydrogenase [Novosphingobium mangrovi (ex Huang et al. 2023)]|uniref:PQQ-dependent sugar dehydrogenase n=1 Tax=Novosphingobium mangrovi (ex Huang et al. 2023) TaxID=2976432 RepID=A0ABT2I3L9_9SPHN|nr:PQQ-dependent sugar dehydrogenase [Novosphingobium mangrovi (ex Huang et al. 2023)]MCT2399405.1 PQQ-dependent sugar dehydrogenase [Novosphingobium mangrovi (ex Huang et al. 2023)]